MEIMFTSVIESLTTPVMKNLGYLTSYTKHLRDMEAEMTRLDAARQDVEQRLNVYTRSRLEVPAQAISWLEDVRKIKEIVENIPSDVGSCFNFKIRYKLGRKALKMLEEIGSVRRQHSEIHWAANQIPLGKVDFINASTSTTSSDHNDIRSRDWTFREALKALEPNHKSHMIALWGMGGVGKTMMMKRLKEVVIEKKMFSFIVVAVVGEKTDTISIQKVVAEYLGIELRETSRHGRADKLRDSINVLSRGGTEKFLFILDDVWQFIDLNDIGLSPMPNRGVDFKVLLTSRDKGVCYRMGVEANLILNVGLLMEAEAHSLFRQFVKNSEDVDPELHKIGEAIVRRCCGLPIAIESMADTLRSRSKYEWNYVLYQLKDHWIPDVVAEVFKISYDNLQDEETRSIFILCGLFPQGFDIPIEDLVRYGWGLKLFKRVSTIREARNKMNTCIKRLIHTNLLIKSVDDVGCVKMHDLVLAFVLDMFSNGEHASNSFVKYKSMQEWPGNDMSRSCERISGTCMGMSEFPRDLKFPNLSILKLMNGGDESLSFPENFYGDMEKLQVIAYEKMKYPLLPTSLDQCSTNLRVLYLHQCPLMFDCSSIGELLNLEVLSLANSGIEWLPSTVGNLKKLRLLDLTNCVSLRIDDGVLKNLVKLEELYMRLDDRMRSVNNDRKAISLTDDNYNEMAECSKHLSALEFEFFQNDAEPKNMSFENLERFKISVGRSLKGAFTTRNHSFENTLMLVTNKRELFESKMNELFAKTDVLSLSVDDMKHLEDVEVKFSHPPQSSSFYSLGVLVVSECAELRYLFALGVARALSNLEHLEVYSCGNMEQLINSAGQERITFPRLKYLSLISLPNLLGLCRDVNRIELPQLEELGLGAIPNITSIYPTKKLSTSCFLKEEVVIPKLEKLHIRHMEKLKEIWPCEFGANEEADVSLLRKIEVMDCDNLVNLFPCNPMSLLHHLEHLEVRNCGSIEVLFNISVGEIKEEEGTRNSSLRRIEVYQLGKLRELWRIEGADSSHLIQGFQAVEHIEITKCSSFRNVFAPTTTNFDLGALMEIWINNNGETRRNSKLIMESSHEREINSQSNEETSEVSDCIPNVVFPSSLIHSFHNLHKLKLWNYEGVEVVFEIESPRSRELVTFQDDQQRLLPYLEELDIRHMDDMSHVWKCNWSKFLILQNQQSESPIFHNLTAINISACKSIKYLFSPLIGKLLSNLKNVKIAICDDIEEVVSSRHDDDDEMTTPFHTSTTLFPRLEFLTLDYLTNLKYIGGGGGGGGAKRQGNELSLNDTTTIIPFHDQSKSPQVDGVSWSLCQFSSEIIITDCHALSSVIPSYAVGQMQKLQVLKIQSCKSMKEVFETQGMDNSGTHSTNVDEGNGGTSAIPRPNNVIMLQLPNLKILEIKDCGLLEHVFTFSALESLAQLEELTIKNCKAMKVIVEEEHADQTKASTVVVFHRLKSIALVNLQNLMGFFLGMNEFQWPSLDKVTVDDCPKMISFKPGRSGTQVYTSKLRNITS